MVKNILDSAWFVIKYMIFMGLFFGFFIGLYFITKYVGLIIGLEFIQAELVVMVVLLFTGHLFRHKLDDLFHKVLAVASSRRDEEKEEV